MTNFPACCRNRSVLALAFWGLVLAGISLFQAGNWPTPAYLADETVPDGDYEPSDPFPARQRARHLERFGVHRWHDAGLRGQGIKIAILDTGFRGYREHLGKALPERVTVRSFRVDGNFEAKDSQHGILCAEVIHAMAPEAELLLVNWDADSPRQFLEAIRWARREGARVVSCSIIMPSWSDGEGGGVVNRELAKIVGAGERHDDLLCFASAGNTAQRHWHGAFHDGGAGLHEWRPGRTSNRLSPWGSERVSVELYWQPGRDYELVVTTSTGRRIGKTATYCGEDRCCSVIQFMPEEDKTYRVQVRRKQTRLPANRAEKSPDNFHVVVLGGGLSYATARGSISCPADCPAVLAVGAVHPDGRRAGYSSCGPNSCKPKPDFMAPVPFPSLWRDRPFTGTSAAAPQAAGLAALCWSRHPCWTAQQIHAALRSAAADLGPPGHDHETGYGLITLPSADSLSSITNGAGGE